MDKGGSQSTTVSIPKWLQDAARTNMARADTLAQIGYTPYYGPDVAAFSPMQLAAMQGTNSAASAFGMAAPSDPMSGMPQPQTYAGGVQGYSSQPLYAESLAALQAAAPGQYAALLAPFINPVTGETPASPFNAVSAPGGGGGGGGGGSRRAYNPTMNIGSGEGATPGRTTPSSWSSVRDMYDGGGAGRSGSTFSGGPASRALNNIGVRPAGSGGSSSGMGGGK